jgi:nicotinate-nucleotide adenylyltransferase
VNAPHALRVFYGGTFDPVHNGHLAIAEAAHALLDTDIDILPAADPPHRAPPGASAQDRVAMLRLAIAGRPGLRLDLMEIERHARDDSRRSWSVDTLRALRDGSDAQAPIAWLIGADSFIGLPTWKCWRELFELTHFIVADRPGSPLEGGLAEDKLPAELEQVLEGRRAREPAALRRAPAGRVLFMHQPLQPESATELRQRITAGLPWRSLVPAAVADYIAQHRLYEAHPDAAIIGSRPGAPL